MTIGLLVSELKDAYVRDLCLGAKAAAKDHKADLIIFPAVTGAILTPLSCPDLSRRASMYTGKKDSSQSSGQTPLLTVTGSFTVLMWSGRG